MANAEYKKFIKALGKKTITLIDPEVEVLGIQVEGVDITISHRDAVEEGGSDQGVVILACDMGEVPQENRCTILEKVLEVGMHMTGLLLPYFGFEPQSQHLLLISVLPMNGIDVELALDMISKLVLVAKDWQETHFLDKIGDTEFVPSNPVKDNIVLPVSATGASRPVRR